MLKNFHVPRAYRCCGGQKVSDPLLQEPQGVGSDLMWVLGMKPRSSARRVIPLHQDHLFRHLLLSDILLLPLLVCIYGCVCTHVFNMS